MPKSGKRKPRHGPHADKYAGVERRPVPPPPEGLPRVSIVTSQADIRRRDALRQARAEERETKRAARKNGAEPKPHE